MNKFEEKMFDTLVDRDISHEILVYIKNLQKKAELADHYKHLYSEVKKQKDDVVELVKNQYKIRNYYEYEECGYDEYNHDDDFKEELLRMLGEIDEL